MEPPAGTFIARGETGAIRLPPTIYSYCQVQGWTLFHFEVVDRDHMVMRPVLAGAPDAPFHASLGEDGLLWIPAELRESVALGEQSVMLRIENATIRVYLRKVFDTLGFRPRY
jgi:hypothetical protein